MPYFIESVRLVLDRVLEYAGDVFDLLYRYNKTMIVFICMRYNYHLAQRLHWAADKHSILIDEQFDDKPVFVDNLLRLSTICLKSNRIRLRMFGQFINSHLHIVHTAENGNSVSGVSAYGLRNHQRLDADSVISDLIQRIIVLSSGVETGHAGEHWKKVLSNLLRWYYCFDIDYGRGDLLEIYKDYL